MHRITHRWAMGIAAVALICGAAGVLRAQQNLTTAMVAPNLYVIEGGGGNTAFLVTDEGVLAVDTKLANFGDRILAEIRKVTDKPILYVVNTHVHGDHLGSNDSFPLPTTLIAQDNVRERLMAMNGPAAKAPRITYRRRSSIYLGGQRVDLHYVGRGHTDGDTIVHFTNLRIAHMGDLFIPRSSPFVDARSGGSALAFPQTLTRAAAIEGVETYIPGHAARTATPAQLQDVIGLHRDMRTVVDEAVKAGKPAEGLEKDPRLAKYADWGSPERLVANLGVLHGELREAARENDANAN